MRVGMMMAIAPLLLTGCAFKSDNPSALEDGQRETLVEDNKVNIKGSANVEEFTDKVMPKSSAAQPKATNEGNDIGEDVVGEGRTAILSDDKMPVTSTLDTATKQSSTTDAVANNDQTVEGTALVDTVGFILPSGNIYCLTYDGILRCEMKSLLNPMPAQPESCDLDWGGGVVLADEGPAEVLCAGDTIAESYDTLTYGSIWRNGAFECQSESIGLTCKTTTDQGFFLSRERWEVF